jgi:hypothetical protein
MIYFIPTSINILDRKGSFGNNAFVYGINSNVGFLGFTVALRKIQ